MVELANLKFSTCAYFYKLKEGVTISKKDIEWMLKDVTSSKMKTYLFDKHREELPNGVQYSLRVFKDKPQMPIFIDADDDNWKEQKIGYYLFIEYCNHIAILKKNCVVPKNMLSKLESIDYEKLITLYTDNNTEFKKLNMQNLDGSDYALRSKSFEALDLKENISPIGVSRYYIRSLKGNNGSNYFALTMSTSKIHDFKDLGTINIVCDWVKDTIDKINNNVAPISDFLNTFAKPIKYEDIRETLKPMSLLLFTDWVTALIDSEAKFYYLKNSNRRDLAKRVIERGLSAMQCCFESVKQKDRDGVISYFTGPNDCIEIKLLKHGIKIANPKWDNIIIEETVNGEYDGTLSELINKHALFNIYFSDTELVYNNRTLFKDTKLLGSAHHLLNVLKPEMNTDFLCEKYSKPSPEGLNDWDDRSIFKYVESNFMEKYRYFICDDCGIEWADHIGIHDGKVTFFIEKHKKSKDSASDFQDVVGQALKNIANLIPSKNQLDEKSKVWSKDYQTSNIPRFRSEKGNVYDAINEWLKNNQRPNCQREMCLVVDFLEKKKFTEQLNNLVAEHEVKHEAELRMRLWILSSFVNTCLEYGVTPLIYCRP